MSYFVNGRGWCNMSQSACDWEEEYDELEREREELEREREEYEYDRRNSCNPSEEDIKKFLEIYDYVEKWFSKDSKESSTLQRGC